MQLEQISVVCESDAVRERLPLASLLALAAAGFLTILTETLPAGLLPQISDGLHVSQGLAGQLVTVYAVGSLVAAIPLTSATQRMRRRPLLLAAIAGFAVANIVTAIASSYAAVVAARLLAGVSAGLLWTLLAGYASRMVAPHMEGRAIAVAMVGTPLALSIGVPAGTFLGAWVGWRISFGIMSTLTLLLIGWTCLKVPDFPGADREKRSSLAEVWTMPGIRPILTVTLAFVLAHNILYTYIAPFLAQSGMVAQTDRILLAFGVAALLGIWVIGALIDRQLRLLTLGAIILFVMAVLILGLVRSEPMAVYGGVAVWGLAFGGAATLFQTASAKAARSGADVAQSMIVTVWNLAIAGGGIMGGLILDGLGSVALVWSLLPLLIASFFIVRSTDAFGAR
ncbi:MFS transporter [Gluconobacter wancherniae]|uniref:MFS transporter n=1 Tax=Gluconobacter wancherniae TaxID=1307955 RepID=UPI001B8AFFC1|nr:MFS transporter [Gluconobacter wancherniae]MBS1095817.1 MFS transporter [Gluconobacter wancherniae]